MKQIPNLFTLLNLIFGCCAIVFCLENGLTVSIDETGSSFIELPQAITMASLFIGLAAVVDFLDGFVARLFNATSEMGKQLDSLADVVSFGVAPSMIVYYFIKLSIAGTENGLEQPWWWALPAFVLAGAAAWRLAKFNLDTTQSFGFKGVPTPAAGLLVASLPLIYWGNANETVIQLFHNKWFWYALVALLSGLMVSNLPLMALKFKSLAVKENLPKIMLVLIAVIAGIFLKWLAVPVVFACYIAVSLLFKKNNA